MGLRPKISQISIDANGYMALSHINPDIYMFINIISDVTLFPLMENVKCSILTFFINIYICTFWVSVFYFIYSILHILFDSS